MAALSLLSWQSFVLLFFSCALHFNQVLSFTGSQYTLDTEYSGTNFFDGWDFYTGRDPTGGFVTYYSRSSSQISGLINATDNDPTYIGVDYVNYLPYNNVTGSGDGAGRPSVRISSKRSWTHGLFIGDFSHAPGGVCGTWPAFWTLGPNWPYTGEIDILEGVNQNVENIMSLHTNETCLVTANASIMTGTLGNTNCAYYPDYNVGCGVIDTRPTSFGKGFNAVGGGVYAMQWTSEYIRIWQWSRDQTPDDVNDKTPDPSSWGLPVSQLAVGNCSVDQHFQQHKIVFDTTFCGEYAGNPYVWNTTDAYSCATTLGLPTCDNYVANYPGAFKEAYWSINYVRVYQLVDPGSSMNSSTTYIASLQPTNTATTTVAANTVVPTPATTSGSYCPTYNFTVISDGTFQYEIACGFDPPGPDIIGDPYYGFQAHSLEDCVKGCTYMNLHNGTNKCGAVSHNAAINFCYFKKYIDGTPVLRTGFNEVRLIYYGYPAITDDPRMAANTASETFIETIPSPQTYRPFTTTSTTITTTTRHTSSITSVANISSIGIPALGQNSTTTSYNTPPYGVNETTIMVSHNSTVLLISTTLLGSSPITTILRATSSSSSVITPPLSNSITSILTGIVTATSSTQASSSIVTSHAVSGSTSASIATSSFGLSLSASVSTATSRAEASLSTSPSTTISSFGFSGSTSASTVTPSSETSLSTSVLVPTSPSELSLATSVSITLSSSESSLSTSVSTITFSSKSSVPDATLSMTPSSELSLSNSTSSTTSSSSRSTPTESNFYIAFDVSTSGRLKRRALKYLSFDANGQSILVDSQADAAVFHLDTDGSVMAGSDYIEIASSSSTTRVFGKTAIKPAIPVTLQANSDGTVSIPGTQGFCSTSDGTLNVIPEGVTDTLANCTVVSPQAVVAPSNSTLTLSGSNSSLTVLLTTWTTTSVMKTSTIKFSTSSTAATDIRISVVSSNSHHTTQSSTHTSTTSHATSSLINSFVYAGCFGVSGSIPGVSPVADSANITNESCTKLCHDTSSYYAGLHNTTCFCGMNEQVYDSLQIYPKGSCTLPCPGNLNETCGGVVEQATGGPIGKREDTLLLITLYNNTLLLGDPDVPADVPTLGISPSVIVSTQTTTTTYTLTSIQSTTGIPTSSVIYSNTATFTTTVVSTTWVDLCTTSGHDPFTTLSTTITMLHCGCTATVESGITQPVPSPTVPMTTVLKTCNNCSAPTMTMTVPCESAIAASSAALSSQLGSVASPSAYMAYDLPSAAGMVGGLTNNASLTTGVVTYTHESASVGTTSPPVLTGAAANITTSGVGNVTLSNLTMVSVPSVRSSIVGTADSPVSVLTSHAVQFGAGWLQILGGIALGLVML